MNLEMFGASPRRVLIGEGFTSCQEDRKRTKVDGEYVDDRVRFAEILADSNLNEDAENPTYNITHSNDILSNAKNRAIKAIEDKVTENCYLPLTITISHGELTFDADKKSQGRIERAYLKAVKEDENHTQPWIAEDNNTYILTKEDVFLIGDAIGLREQAEVLQARARKDEVESKESASEVYSYLSSIGITLDS